MCGGLNHWRKRVQAQPGSDLSAVEISEDLFAAFLFFLFWLRNRGFVMFYQWRDSSCPDISPNISLWPSHGNVVGRVTTDWRPILKRADGWIQDGGSISRWCAGGDESLIGVISLLCRPVGVGHVSHICNLSVAPSTTGISRCMSDVKWWGMRFTYFPPNYKVLTTPLLMSKAVRGLCFWPKYSPDLLKYL